MRLPEKLSLLAAVLLPACTTTTVPPTSVHQPMTVRPTPVVAGAVNGGIYNPASARPLFEDRRARYVGDTITVVIAEKTSASKVSQSKTSRSSNFNVGAPTVTGLPFKVPNVGITADSSNTFDGKGQNNSGNDFSGTITVTVTEVYPNGNLLVSGEKQIGLKEGEEFVRFSGVVNPTFVSGTNTVVSTQVADARIEYKANGALNDATVMGWLGRFFQSILPF